MFSDMEKGKLIISLDFELLWGVFDKVDYKDKISYFENTREVIPEILKLFSESGIACTWATVGMLFNKDWKDWGTNFPSEIPLYEKAELSAYKYGKKISSVETENLCFAPDLIQQIINTPRQELATHTYSHYYCSEKGQSASAFQADLEKAISMAEKLGVEFRSLVFPRNQLNDDYLKICSEKGIHTVRSNPASWYWEETQNSSFWKKVFRTGDAYFGSNNKSYSISELRKLPGKPLEQPASRLLRPYSTNNFLNRLKLKRIKSEMLTAAKKDQVYHIWWHPHNFGEYPRESMLDLREIIDCFHECRNQFGFESLSMRELYSRI